MCTRAVLLVSLAGTVWGCGSLEDPCEDKGHKLNKGQVFTTRIGCKWTSTHMYPQIFQGNISTKSDVNLTIYSVNRAGDKTKTLVATEISNSAWKLPADGSKCDPLQDCYIGKHSDHINVDIECNSKDGCEVDTILSYGCGNNGAPVNCGWTDWTPCTGSGVCHHVRFPTPNLNGGAECHGSQYQECACPGQPTHSPGYTYPPTVSPTLSPTGPSHSPTSPTMNPGSTRSPNATESPTESPSQAGPGTPTMSPAAPPDQNTTSSPVAPSSSSSKVGIIVGASVGGAVVVAAIVGAIIWQLKCRKAKDAEQEGLLNEGSGA